MSWFDLPTWLQMLLSLAVIAGGAAVTWFISGRIGVVVLAIGVAMMVVSGRDNSDRRGYKF